MAAAPESSITAQLSESAVQPSRTGKRRWLFRLCAGLLAIVLAEFFSFLALVFLDGAGAHSDHRHLQTMIAQGTPAKGESNETIHPYTGWSFNPQVAKPIEIEGREIPVNRLGLLDDGPTIVPRSDKRIVIAIAGGSVAWQLSVLGEESLRKALQADPRFDGREIDIVRLTLPGQKQPQQLMTLAWVQSLGAEFDVVVNLDGYNEAVLAISGNYANHHVNIAYPRAWHARTLDIVEAREYADSYQLLRVRGTRQGLARNALRSPFRRSSTYQLLWRLRSRALAVERDRLSMKLLENNQEVGGRGFVASGPIENFKNEDEAHDAAIDLWVRCSVQMHHLVTGCGAVYVHAMQPNQYLPGSKPLSEMEASQYCVEWSVEGRIVKQIYPGMIAAGDRLRNEGVRFYDLTSVFSDMQETLYADVCCHYNIRGNEILAEHVAAAILDSMAD